MPLFSLIIAVLIVGFLFWLVDKMPIAEPFKTIAKGLAVFVLLLYLVFFVFALLGEPALPPLWPRH